MTNALHALLESLNACGEAVEWTEKYDTLAEAWEACERGDWMVWLAARLCDRKAVVLAVCECARLAMKRVPDGEDRPRIAIETAEAWARGNATIQQVRDAADGAIAAARATREAIAEDAEDAADAAAYAAHAADAVADGAIAAARAADAVHMAALAAGAVEAANAVLSQCADIARKHFRVENETLRKS